MREAVLHGPRDLRFEERDAPTIIQPTDAILRISATCVCGSDLWPYRGISPVNQPTPMGHEYCGIVEEVGGAVTSIQPGQFVIGSFFASDNTCPNCRAGYQSSCQSAEVVSPAQAPLLRVPLADGTLVATPGIPSDGMIPSLLTLSDVMGTGWFAADAANEAGQDRRGRRRRRGRTARRALRKADGRGPDHRDEPSPVAAEARPGVRRDGHRDRAGRRGRRANQGADPRNRRRLGVGVCRHSGVDDAGDPFHTPRRLRELRGRPARGRARGPGVVLRPRPSPRRSRSGAPLPARANRPRVERKDQPRQGLRPDPALDRVAEGYRAMDERRAIKALLRP